LSTEEQKAKARAAMAKSRAKKKAEGFVPPPSTPETRAAAAERMRRWRERQVAAGKDPNPWWKNNRDRHRENVQAWRDANRDTARTINRDSQEKRRKTPWGAINNRIWPLLHYGVRQSIHQRKSKYAAAMGYTWAELRAHLEAQFTPDMNWDNWGDVWELDHIDPLANFLYLTLDDPLFKQAWRLENLRPLHKHLNQSKGSKWEPKP